VSLRARLFAAIGAAAILSVALALAIGAALTRRAVEANTLRDVSAQADLLAERERSALLPFSRLPQLQPFLDRQRERIVAAKLDGSSPYLPPEEAARLRRGTPLDGTITVDGRRSFYAARLVGGKAFILLRPTDAVESSWRPHARGLVIAAAVAGVLAAVAAFFLARAISRPVRRVAESARLLAGDESPAPLPVEGARELALLAASFNESAEQLARARAAERQFLLSVSHELKTPLTAIRGYAEGLAEGVLGPDEAAETIRREAVRLERLVRDLLDLARMNKREFSVRRVPIDLAEVAREVSRRYEPQARAFEVELVVSAPEPAPAVGDADRMVQVVSNLVENALRVTPAGGSVRVVASAGSIAVEDTGPGLQAEELPRAFERFYLYSRYGRERPVGTGLGLAIVKQLAEGMGGSVAVSSASEGLTVFTVRLPLPAEAGFTPVLRTANSRLTGAGKDERVSFDRRN
jgi:two-component system, OmpR family, sensor kinase